MNYLNELATKYKTDKYNAHWYTPHYSLHFSKWENSRINLLEIGVDQGGSLKMWKEYFVNGQIFGLDIEDKKQFEEDRIRIFRGDQSDVKCLRNIYQEMEHMDIIIDDGSHINKHIITSFETLFPLLNNGGIYVVEDLQTSYWAYEGFGGDSNNLNNTDTAMGFFKGLVDGLNHQERIQPGYTPTYYDKYIVSMHFYHNMIFIYKGLNNEESTVIRNNSIEHLPGFHK